MKLSNIHLEEESIFRKCSKFQHGRYPFNVINYLSKFTPGTYSRLLSIVPVRASDPMTASFRKTLTSGLGLDDMSLAWPAVVQLLVFIYSGIQ